MKYTVSKSGTLTFTVKDDSGNVVAYVLNENEANLFAHVPELLDMLDACVDMSKMYSLSEAIDLQEKIKKFRK